MFQTNVKNKNKLPKMRVKILDDNLVLRDPVTKKRVTTEGLVVEKNSFWLRRLKNNEIIIMGD